MSGETTGPDSLCHRTVNVVAKDYAYGLAQSGSVVVEALHDAGFRARNLSSHYGADSIKDRLVLKLRRVVRNFCYATPLGRIWRRDFNIFLEKFHPDLAVMAGRQIFIPNQEWVFEWDLKQMARADLLICKSRHAEEIFSKLGFRTAYSGFTSRDRRLVLKEPKQRAFLLMAGERPKIAETIIGCWSKHPEWPLLTVSSTRFAGDVDLPNVRLMRKFVPEEEITRQLNSHQFHLGVTAAEGFGHKLNEGLSCGAIVLAMDGPPMNELVTPDCGILVKYARSNPLGCGTEFHFDEADLEAKIEECLRLAPSDIERLSVNARKAFEENDRRFRKALPEILRNFA